MGFKTETWIGWLAASVATLVPAAVGATVFAYAQFETKDHADERIQGINDRLSHIETKIDENAMVNKAILKYLESHGGR